MGGEFVGWWTEGDLGTLNGFAKRFPTAPRFANRQALQDNPEINLILIAAIPSDRAALAIEAMEHGKDVMLHKPGCTTAAQLTAIQTTVECTGRIWPIDFSERFEAGCVSRTAEVVQKGAIGKFVHTAGWVRTGSIEQLALTGSSKRKSMAALFAILHHISSILGT